MRANLRSEAILPVNNRPVFTGRTGRCRMIGELMEELKKKVAPRVTSAQSAPPEPEMRAADTEGREEEIRKTEKIRQQLETEKSQIAGGTYAQILQGQDDRVAKRAPVLHSVIVVSKDEKETGEEVLEKVRKTERRRVKERLQGAKEDLTVEEINNHDPLVILRDVLYVKTDEEIGKALKNQNKEIFKDEENARYEIKYRRRHAEVQPLWGLPLKKLMRGVDGGSRAKVAYC
ncbi:hypothetical protein ACJJTC_008546 [Scirpophaga incertulas]